MGTEDLKLSLSVWNNWKKKSDKIKNDLACSCMDESCFNYAQTWQRLDDRIKGENSKLSNFQR